MAVAAVEDELVPAGAAGEVAAARAGEKTSLALPPVAVAKPLAAVSPRRTLPSVVTVSCPPPT